MTGREVLLGAVAGSAAGMIGAVVAAIIGRAAKQLRNTILVRRGQAPYKDVVFRPLWVAFGILGAIAGASWTWRLSGTWHTGAIAGFVAPALLTLVVVVASLVQAARRS